MKKLLAMALALLMLAVMLPATAMAAQPSVDWTNHNSENVYWVSGDQSGYTATLAAALTEAYKANEDDITIVCRPNSDVGAMTHGHVADSITIYGNNAYISGGECDLEVDTFMFSRDTGSQVKSGGAYLDKDITITASNLYNLGVWGQRNTDHTVNINLTNCDSKEISGEVNVQRVYISGTAGANNITVTGCDFLTKATALYSNADGTVVIDNCTFKGGQVPVNFNHKADGKQIVTVKNSTFTNCGDAGKWSAFAAPVRFVNSGNGSLDATIENNTFTGTVGDNGDILLGDQRVGERSLNVNAEIVTKQDVTVKSGNSEKSDKFKVKANTSVKANAAGEQPEVIRDNVIIIYTPDSSPVFLSGANQTVAPGSAATFRIDKEFSELQSVAVDGVTLDKSNYKAWSGSTYVELTAAHMKTLAVGTHTLSVYFTGDTATTTFTISKDATKNPTTGANDFVGAAAALAVVSLLGMVVASRKK